MKWSIDSISFWEKDPVPEENKYSKFKPTILGTKVSTTF